MGCAATDDRGAREAGAIPRDIWGLTIGATLKRTKTESPEVLEHG